MCPRMQDQLDLPPLPVLPEEPTPYRRVLAALFLRPYLALQAVRAQRRWLAPILILFLMTFLAALLKVMLTLPGIVGETRTITSHLAQAAEAVWFENGRLRWQAEWNLPHTIRVNLWRFDFADQPKAFPPDRELASSVEPRGLLLEPASVTLWLREEGNDRQVLRIQLLAGEKLAALGRQATEMASRDQGRLDEAALVRYSQAFCVAMAPFLLAYHALLQIKPILLSVLIFMLTALVFRREWRDSPASLWTVALHCCIPPFLLALVYSFLDLPGWDFQEMFLVAFLLYLVFIYFDTKAFLLPEPPEDPEE